MSLVANAVCNTIRRAVHNTHYNLHFFKKSSFSAYELVIGPIFLCSPVFSVRKLRHISRFSPILFLMVVYSVPEVSVYPFMHQYCCHTDTICAEYRHWTTSGEEKCRYQLNRLKRCYVPNLYSTVLSEYWDDSIKYERSYLFCRHHYRGPLLEVGLI